jgi:Zn-dependent protease with chaperone function
MKGAVVVKLKQSCRSPISSKLFTGEQASGKHHSGYQSNVIVVWFILFACCAGCATGKPLSKTSVMKFDENRPAYQRLANAGNRVAQAMGQDRKGFRYGILDTDSLNAAVDQKQRAIFVTAGLLYQLNNSELLCVLAHEWAHVTLGHYDKRRDAANTTDAISTLVSGLTPVGLIASALINPAVKESFSRTQEEEADSEAARILHDRLKISSYACVSAFQKLASYAEQTGGDEGGGLLDSHPSFGDRINRLKKAWPDVPKAYYVSEIIVRSPEEVRAVLQRLGAGEPFTRVATAFSVDGLVKVNKGELGRFEAWELNPLLLAALQKQKGKSIVVFRSPAGFRIVKMAEMKEPRDSIEENQ